MAKQETFAEKLCEVLAREKILTKDDANNLKKSFAEYSKHAFTTFLLDEGLVDKPTLLEALAEVYDVPSFDVSGHMFDTDLLKKFPEDFLHRNAIIPLEVDENMLFVVASEPDNPDLLSKIGNFVSYDIQFNVGLKNDIADAITEFYDRSLSELDEVAGIDREEDDNRLQKKSRKMLRDEDEE